MIVTSKEDMILKDKTQDADPLLLPPLPSLTPKLLMPKRGHLR